MKVYKKITDLIGNTPLVELGNYSKFKGIEANLYGKLECFNPAGSAKDRIAKKMLDKAEAEGLIKEGATIIEPTSGNTGIGLAAVAAARGYKAIFTMPETMSVERQNLLKAYGAEIVLTDGRDGMSGAIKKANELMKRIQNSFIPGQFTNLANPQAHYETTGPEIYSDLDGNVDIFVAGVGTGGTLSGAGKYLKQKNKDIKIVAVEPKDSPVLSEGRSGAHQIQGIGADFVPDTLDVELIDEIITITSKDAFETGRLLARKEGILVGISSGAAVWAATEIAKRPENKGKNIVIVMTDTGERYLSTPMFSE